MLLDVVVFENDYKSSAAVQMGTDRFESEKANRKKITGEKNRASLVHAARNTQILHTTRFLL
jgi:hypothetical protein